MFWYLQRKSRCNIIQGKKLIQNKLSCNTISEGKADLLVSGLCGADGRRSALSYGVSAHPKPSRHLSALTHSQGRDPGNASQYRASSNQGVPYTCNQNRQRLRLWFHLHVLFHTSPLLRRTTTSILSAFDFPESNWDNLFCHNHQEGLGAVYELSLIHI